VVLTSTQAENMGISHVTKKPSYLSREIEESTTAVCVIDCNGVVAYITRSGAFNSNFLVDFTETNLIDYFLRHPTKILLMDNVRFHHSPKVKALLTTNNICFKYIPPYSPQLNPIEEFFSMVKARFVARRHTLQSVDQCLTDVLHGDFGDSFAGFYRHLSEWIVKALTRTPSV